MDVCFLALVFLSDVSSLVQLPRPLLAPPSSGPALPMLSQSETLNGEPKLKLWEMSRIYVDIDEERKRPLSTSADHSQFQSALI